MVLPAWALTTVAAARMEVHASSTEADEKMEQLVRAASARINQYCGYTLRSTVYAKVGTVDVRMQLDGNDSMRIRASAFPLTAVTSCEYHDADGVEASIDITGASFDREAGIITLAQDYFWGGSSNILLTCTAGLETDSMGLEVVSHACLRLVAAWYDRWKNALGITTSALEGGVRTVFSQDEMPQEVIEMLQPYVWVGWA